MKRQSILRLVILFAVVIGVCIEKAQSAHFSYFAGEFSTVCEVYAQDAYLRNLMLAAAELYPHIPIAMHQDHGNSVETCKSAIDNNFTSVMMDGSLKEDGKTPADFDYNVNVTRQVVEVAHSLGVTVEGELGCLGGIEDGHGAYKFKKKPTGDVLKMDVIEKIHKKMPNCHMVMHGSSSVPKELIEIINEFGGEMPETYGVPVEQIQRGIKHGVRKINVDTDNRLAITGAIRKLFHQNPGKFDPRDYLKPARAAMVEVVKARMEAFGQAGQADKIKVRSLAEMAARY